MRGRRGQVSSRLFLVGQTLYGISRGGLKRDFFYAKKDNHDRTKYRITD
ncbi:hypothetical protein [Bremerella alba]|nr:hypothetical protein [Bremerella alba]